MRVSLQEYNDIHASKTSKCANRGPHVEYAIGALKSQSNKSHTRSALTDKAYINCENVMCNNHKWNGTLSGTLFFKT